MLRVFTRFGGHTGHTCSAVPRSQGQTKLTGRLKDLSRSVYVGCDGDIATSTDPESQRVFAKHRPRGRAVCLSTSFGCRSHPFLRINCVKASSVRWDVIEVLPRALTLIPLKERASQICPKHSDSWLAKRQSVVCLCRLQLNSASRFGLQIASVPLTLVVQRANPTPGTVHS